MKERYRLARNIQPGMEARVTDTATGEHEWHEVASAMHITAPVKVSVIELANGDQFSLSPTQEVMSR